MDSKTVLAFLFVATAFCTVNASYRCYDCTSYEWSGAYNAITGDTECADDDDTIDDASTTGCSRGCATAEQDYEILDDNGDTVYVTQIIRGCADNRDTGCDNNYWSSSEESVLESAVGLLYWANTLDSAISTQMTDERVCGCQLDYCNGAKTLGFSLMSLVLVAIASLLSRF